MTKKKTAKKKAAKKKVTKKKGATKKRVYRRKKSLVVKKPKMKKEDVKSFDDFLKLLDDHDIRYTQKVKGRWGYDNSKPITTEPYISVEWCVGGQTGGSCWGGEPEGFSNTDFDDELKELDNILILICPEITFLQYKKLTNDVLKKDDFSGGWDYYGNFSDYVVKYVILEDLYEALLNMNLL